MSTLVEVKDLTKHFPLKGRLFLSKEVIHAVDGVSFNIIEGETYSTETVISFYNVELRASETSINFYTTSITIMVIPLLAYVFKRRKK